MTPWKPSGRANQVLEHHRLRGRSYPTQAYWERLYQMLEEEAERRGKTPPPPPLSYALDHVPTEAEKIDRLREQVAWADRNNLLHRIQMFFDAMPGAAWNRLER